MPITRVQVCMTDETRDQLREIEELLKQFGKPSRSRIVAAAVADMYATIKARQVRERSSERPK